jgi:hypothetical protein
VPSALRCAEPVPRPGAGPPPPGDRWSVNAAPLEAEPSAGSATGRPHPGGRRPPEPGPRPAQAVPGRQAVEVSGRPRGSEPPASVPAAPAPLRVGRAPVPVPARRRPEPRPPRLHRTAPPGSPPAPGPWPPGPAGVRPVASAPSRTWRSAGSPLPNEAGRLPRPGWRRPQDPAPERPADRSPRRSPAREVRGALVGDARAGGWGRSFGPRKLPRAAPRTGIGASLSGPAGFRDSPRPQPASVRPGSRRCEDPSMLTDLVAVRLEPS